MAEPNVLRVVGETPVERLAWIRARAERFFPTAGPSEAALMIGLVSDALTLGSTNVTALRFQNWSVVGAELDWLVLGRFTVPEAELFSYLRALPEAGRECHRHEIFVAAFARDVLASSSAGIRIIQGNVTDDDPIFPFLKSRATWARSIAFRVAVA